MHLKFTGVQHCGSWAWAAGHPSESCLQLPAAAQSSIFQRAFVRLQVTLASSHTVLCCARSLLSFKRTFCLISYALEPHLESVPRLHHRPLCEHPGQVSARGHVVFTSWSAARWAFESLTAPEHEFVSESQLIRCISLWGEDEKISTSVRSAADRCFAQINRAEQQRPAEWLLGRKDHAETCRYFNIAL